MTDKIRRDFGTALQTWKEALRPYQRPDLRRSCWQLINSLVPHIVLWYTAYRLLEVSYWASLGVCVLAAAFLVRVFIISHDCGHGAFFRSRRANSIWGAITSIMTLIPYHAWRHEHAVHHAHSGNLDRRGVGDIDTLTVREYVALSRWERFRYRVYRNPVTLFVVAPLYVFVISYRFWPKGANRRARLSVIRTNIALLGIAVVMSLTIGLKAWLMIQLPIMAISGTAGVWLFYVQHQFEGVYWERNDTWDFVEQALEGSSFYKLPAILQWFSGNIGFHHIHHLSARIPNYYLPKCQRELSFLQRVKPITLIASFKSLTFRLWDEERRKLVGFSSAKLPLRNPAAS